MNLDEISSKINKFLAWHPEPYHDKGWFHALKLISFAWLVLALIYFSAALPLSVFKRRKRTEEL